MSLVVITQLFRQCEGTGPPLPPNARPPKPPAHNQITIVVNWVPIRREKVVTIYSNIGNKEAKTVQLHNSPYVRTHRPYGNEPVRVVVTQEEAKHDERVTCSVTWGSKTKTVRELWGPGQLNCFYRPDTDMATGQGG